MLVIMITTVYRYFDLFVLSYIKFFQLFVMTVSCIVSVVSDQNHYSLNMNIVMTVSCIVSVVSDQNHYSLNMNIVMTVSCIVSVVSDQNHYSLNMNIVMTVSCIVSVVSDQNHYSLNMNMVIVHFDRKVNEKRRPRIYTIDDHYLFPFGHGRCQRTFVSQTNSGQDHRGQGQS